MTLPGITDKSRQLGPNMDWHVLYTAYLERIADGKAHSGWTPEEGIHVGMVVAWRDDIAAAHEPNLAYCWTVEPSLQRQS